MKAIKGQLGILTWKNEGQNAQWCYCVVEHVFDNRVQLRKDDGYMYLHVMSENENINKVVENQPTYVDLTMLYKCGMPVMAKKKLLGGYKVKP